jgi:YesN/AraC family two-component response regulator
MTETPELESLEVEDLQYTLLIDSTVRILVVDDEEIAHKLFGKLLEDEDLHVDFASSGEAGFELVIANDYQLMIIDKNLPGMSGLELAVRVNKIRPQIEFIVITGYSSYESAVEALRLGAFDYIEKPFPDLKLVKQKIMRAIEKQRLTQENAILSDHLREAHAQMEKTIGELSQIKDVDSESARAVDLERRLEGVSRLALQAADEIEETLKRLKPLAEGTSVKRKDLVDIRGQLRKAWVQLASNLAEYRGGKK